MADKFTRFLSGFGSGVLNPKGNLGDSRHASRVFVDGAMARAPKTKFLFHVYFDINWDALGNDQWRKRHEHELSLLVKNSSLPRFTFDTDVKNQYNRKKMIYKNINYDPIQVKFHDDSIGIINALWSLYYSYYSPEREQEAGAWQLGDKSQTGTGPYNNGEGIDSGKYRYGLDSDKVNKPFFNNIIIYTMSHKRFNSYKLVNPYIRTWDHGSVDYAESSGTVEATMDIGYESVIYGAGEINTEGQADPKAFAISHYDKVPSPLSILGGAQSSLFGPGGILAQDTGTLAGAKQIFGDNYQQGTASVNGIQAAIGAINTFKSLSNITPESLATEALNLTLTPNRAQNLTSGLPGLSFPSTSNSKK